MWPRGPRVGVKTRAVDVKRSPSVETHSSPLINLISWLIANLLLHFTSTLSFLFFFFANLVNSFLLVILLRFNVCPVGSHCTRSNAGQMGGRPLSLLLLPLGDTEVFPPTPPGSSGSGKKPKHSKPSEAHCNKGLSVYFTTGLSVYFTTGLSVYFTTGLSVYFKTGLSIYFITGLSVYFTKGFSVYLHYTTKGPYNFTTILPCNRFLSHEWLKSINNLLRQFMIFPFLRVSFYVLQVLFWNQKGCAFGFFIRGVFTNQKGSVLNFQKGCVFRIHTDCVCLLVWGHLCTEFRKVWSVFTKDVCSVFSVHRRGINQQILYKPCLIGFTYTVLRCDVCLCIFQTLSCGRGDENNILGRHRVKSVSYTNSTNSSHTQLTHTHTHTHTHSGELLH